MTTQNQDSGTRLQRLSEKYGDLTTIRVLLQAIPYVGGSLDTLLTDSGEKFRRDRTEKLLEYLADKISTLEGKVSIADIENNEQLYDLMMQAIQQSAKTRSEDKRRRFASILRNQFESNEVWDEPEAALRLVSDLNDLHVQILRAAVEAPVCDEPFSNLSVICLERSDSERHKTGVPPTDISSLFPKIKQSTLQFHCAELMAKGLLKDEGTGRFDTGALVFFAATETANWLFDWLSD